ncbi:MAG: cytochrome b/b6 domain-containing protein [Pseudomonadota bacterium]
MPKRYHPVLVTLHWIIAAMVVGSLLIGGTSLTDMPNSDPDKIAALRTHMAVGVAIFVLMVLRLVVRLRTSHPDEADIGVALLNRLARPLHLTIYALVLAMGLSGLALSVQSGLPPIVFGQVGSLPQDFWAYPARHLHWGIGLALSILVAGHVTAAFYHQIARDNNVMGRMSFGPRED